MSCSSRRSLWRSKALVTRAAALPMRVARASRFFARSISVSQRSPIPAAQTKQGVITRASLAKSRVPLTNISLRTNNEGLPRLSEWFCQAVLDEFRQRSSVINLSVKNGKRTAARGHIEIERLGITRLVTQIRT